MKLLRKSRNLEAQLSWSTERRTDHITETRLFKYIEDFTTKQENFQVNIFFQISAQNIDCSYSLEPPRRGGFNGYHNLCFLRNKKNNVYPCKTPVLHYKSGVYEGQII